MFQWLTAKNSVSVAMEALDKGIIIFRKIWISLHPSILADSSISPGMDSMKLFATIRLHALVRTGRISAHRLLIRFKDFTIIKLGMIPALNISVNTTIPMKSLWNGILFFVST